MVISVIQIPASSPAHVTMGRRTWGCVCGGGRADGGAGGGGVLRGLVVTSDSTARNCARRYELQYYR